MEYMPVLPRAERIPVAQSKASSRVASSPWHHLALAMHTVKKGRGKKQKLWLDHPRAGPEDRHGRHARKACRHTSRGFLISLC
jgi:hypothetical protein